MAVSEKIQMKENHGHGMANPLFCDLCFCHDLRLAGGTPVVPDGGMKQR